MSKIDVSTDRPQGVESDHLRDATKMVATISSTETVKPVAYSYTDAKGRTVLVSTHTAPYEDAQPLYTAPPKREPLTEAELEPIRRRMMMEAYNAADDGDSERYNGLKVMANDVLDMLLGGEK